VAVTDSRGQLFDQESMKTGKFIPFNASRIGYQTSQQQILYIGAKSVEIDF